MLCDSLADLCAEQIQQTIQTTIQKNIIIGPNLQVKRLIQIFLRNFFTCLIFCLIFIETPRWMQNKTLKTIALFGDETVINQQKKMREARLMAEGNN